MENFVFYEIPIYSCQKIYLLHLFFLGNKRKKKENPI